MISGLKTFLASLGLNEKAQRAYFALLKLGDAPASRVAKEATINRATAYGLLNQLRELGLISAYRERGQKRFVAEHPQKIRGFVEGQLKAFEKYLPELVGLFNLAHKISDVRIFQGANGIRSIDEEILRVKQKDIYSIGSAKIVQEILGQSIGFSRRRYERGIILWAVRPENERSMHQRLHTLTKVRFLPDFNPRGILFIFDKKIALITSEAEETGFVIESEDLSNFVKEIFRHLWNAAA